MGAWSASISGNDTALDLKREYACAFYYYHDVDEAVQRIEEYAASYGFDESDQEEYCNYFYSLADFMWKKGILTAAIRDKAVDMIDRGFGLEIWEESGEKILKERKAVLEKFKKQLLSPMGERKKIRPNVYKNEIFENGDLIAMKLMTDGKTYSTKAQKIKKITPEYYSSCDGKYVLIQKVGTHVSWKSEIVPEVKDCWAVFRLFDGIYDTVPEIQDIDALSEAKFRVFSPRKPKPDTPYFISESSMYHFRKRKPVVLGNFSLPEHMIDVHGAYLQFQYDTKSVYLGVYNSANDADSDFLAAMRSEDTVEILDVI